MALPASTVWSSRFRINWLRGQPCQIHGRSLSHAHDRQTLHSRAIKLPTMAQFGEQNNVKMQMSILRKRLWEAAPDSVKDFPWKKAEDIAVQQLLLLAQKAMQWSLVALFIVSSVSDVIFCISRNKELMIPFGLFVGCMTADFLKETSRELFPNSEKTGLEAVPFGHWLLLCLCEVNFHIFYFTRTGISFACCQWWIDANFVAVERFTRRKRWTKWTEFLFRPRGFCDYRCGQLDAQLGPCTWKCLHELFLLFILESNAHKMRYLGSRSFHLSFASKNKLTFRVTAAPS